jgi:transcriptional regulator with GAF, ATPase, and Fis domain
MKSRGPTDLNAGATVTGHLEASAEILGGISDELEAVAESQQVLEVVLQHIRLLYPLNRAAIRRVDGAMLEIVAVWSAERTSLGVGTRMSVASSSLPAILTTGRPVIASVHDPGGFLHELVLSEGIASYVTLPLRMNGVVRGLISFSSGLPDTFKPDDLPFLERVAEAVEARADVLDLG